MNIVEVQSPPWNYNYYIAIHPVQWWCEIGHYLVKCSILLTELETVKLAE